MTPHIAPRCIIPRCSRYAMGEFPVCSVHKQIIDTEKARQRNSNTLKRRRVSQSRSRKALRMLRLRYPQQADLNDKAIRREHRIEYAMIRSTLSEA